MKNWIYFFVALAVTAGVGCGIKNSNSDETIALTPTTDCMNYGYGYNGQCNYPYQQNPGFSQYPYNTQNGLYQYGTNGFCQCPNGSRPVYNSTMGLGCMSNATLDAGAIPYQSYNWNYSTNTWMNVNPTQYQPYSGAITTSTVGCFNNVIVACDSRVAQSCGVGGYCRPVGGGSSLGLCIYNYYN